MVSSQIWRDRSLVDLAPAWGAGTPRRGIREDETWEAAKSGQKF